MKLWPFSRPGGPRGKAIAEAEEQKATTVFDFNSLFLNGGELVLGASEIDRAYQNSWIAYSCIRRLANDAAGVPLVYLSDPKDPDSHVPDSNLTKQLFQNPGPHFSTQELIQWIVMRLNQRGEFFIPFDDAMRPTEMIPQTDPKHWKELVDGIELEGWEYRSGGNYLLRGADELVHHQFVNPENPYRGQAPLTAASAPYGIEVGADRLTLNVVQRGGEKAALYTSEMAITKQQRDQATTALRARRAGNATVGRDVILPNGIKPLDPKFIEDDVMLLEAGSQQTDKITSVYGVPKSLLGFGSEEKYSNALVRKRTYFEDTLVPMLTGITDSFDRFFVYTLTSPYHCYVRFDWSAVPAMQENLAARFEMAGKANKDGIPWAVLNDRFELGLDVSSIPGADTIMVASNLAPLGKLIEEWDSSAPGGATPPTAAGASEPGKAIEGDGSPRLTNKIIRKRARDTRESIARGMRLLRMEREFKRQWKILLQKHMNKAVKLAGRIETADDVEKVLSPAFAGLGESMGKVAAPHQEAAALEGEKAIVILTEGKLDDAESNIWKAQHQWSPGVATFLKKRNNFIKGMGDILFDDVIDAVTETVIDGAEVSEVQHVIRQRFESAPGGINRATTIARTEVGTAYNTARFAEIKEQDFEKHEWLTASDEDVRHTHVTAGDAGPVKVGDDFPGVNLPFPQDPSGPPEEVINCRCETIPVVKG